MAGRLNGDGWDAWLDGDIVRTRALDAQHGVSAGARMDAVAGMLRAGGRAVLMDDRRAGSPSPGAVDVLRDFLRSHRAVPVALVARGQAAEPVLDAMRKGVPGARLACFAEPEPAVAWLRAELGREQLR